MDKDKALDKIQKCFARATGTDSQHEAETALRQARALMEQHHLDSGDVLAAGVIEHQVPCGTKSKPTVWMSRLAAICAEAFACNVVTYGHRLLGWSFRFYGIGLSSELASYAYSTLHHQLVKARKAFVASQKRCKLATKRHRGELFAQGWIDGVYQKVQQFASVPETVTAALLAYEAKHFPKLTTSDLARVKTNRAHDAKASLVGRSAGSNAQLHQGLSTAGRPALLNGGAA